MDWLHVFADLATVITAGVAAYGYGSYRFSLYQRQINVEKLLATKKAPNDDSLTVVQLAAALKLTKDQVIEAAFRSKKVQGIEGLNGERRFKLSGASY